jgi:hypothetical protein
MFVGGYMHALDMFHISSGAFEGPLWHYTSMEAGRAILSTGMLRATDANYLNDYTETRLFRHFLVEQANARYPDASELGQRVLDKCRDRAETPMTMYVVSLSELGDDLPQWRAYGDDGRGCALVFESQALRAAAEAQVDPDLPFAWMQLQCQYLSVEQIRGLANHLLDEVESAYQQEVPVYANALLETALQLAGPALKHPSFEREQEVRFVRLGGDRLPLKQGLTQDPDRETRMRGSLFVPYVNLPIAKSVTELCLGPRHQEDPNRSLYGALCFVRALESPMDLTLANHPYGEPPLQGFTHRFIP